MTDPLILALLASQRVLMDALALTESPIIAARIREHGKEIARTISMHVKSVTGRTAVAGEAVS
jgi:hypothetical protein